MDDPVVIVGAVVFVIGAAVLIFTGKGSPCGPDFATCKKEDVE